MSLTVSVLQGGTNSHETSSEEVNAIATDFVSEGVVGAITNTSGVAPATGGFAVNAQSTPDMTVAVSAGTAYVTGTPTSGNSQTVRVKNSASANVTIAANSTGGTRYDWVYIKLDPDKMKDPASDASDVATLTTSRSTSASTDNGTPPTYGYPIAVVTVANGASSITNGNITDARISTGATPSDSSVTATKIDWASTGSNAGIWWEELGRTTLSSAGDTITISSIPARKYLRIMFTVSPTGGTISFGIRYNNDSGNNYAQRNSINGAADTTAFSQNTMGAGIGPVTPSNTIGILDGINIGSLEKVFSFSLYRGGGASAGNAPDRSEGVVKWSDTSNQITRVDLINTSGTGDFAAGSEVVVLGHN